MVAGGGRRGAELARKETDMKNKAAVMCPNCGTEMVRTRFEIEDGWIHGWLCECQDAMTDVTLNELALLKRTIELLIAAGHVTQDDVSKARQLALSLT